LVPEPSGFGTPYAEAENRCVSLLAALSQREGFGTLWKARRTVPASKRGYPIEDIVALLDEGH
jgi:hypothetical protein